MAAAAPGAPRTRTDDMQSRLCSSDGAPSGSSGAGGDDGEDGSGEDVGLAAASRASTKGGGGGGGSQTHCSTGGHATGAGHLASASAVASAAAKQAVSDANQAVIDLAEAAGQTPAAPAPVSSDAAADEAEMAAPPADEFSRASSFGGSAMLHPADEKRGASLAAFCAKHPAYVPAGRFDNQPVGLSWRDELDTKHPPPTALLRRLLRMESKPARIKLLREKLAPKAATRVVLVTAQDGGKDCRRLLARLRERQAASRMNWLIKDPNMHHGRGKQLLSAETAIDRVCAQPQLRLVQEYNDLPLLVRGRKFHWRTYDLVVWDRRHDRYVVLHNPGNLILAFTQYKHNDTSAANVLTNTGQQQGLPGFSYDELFMLPGELFSYASPASLGQDAAHAAQRRRSPPAPPSTGTSW